MKKFLWTYAIAIILGISFQGNAQSTEKSSGLLRMEMKKGEGNENEVKKEATRQDLSKSAEGSATFRMPVKKKEPAKVDNAPPVSVAVPIAMGSDVIGITWIAPESNLVKTSESTFLIRTTVNSDEHIRFINLFHNGEFERNIIPPVSNIRQMVLEEAMELELGSNILRVEAVTATGNKFESSVEVVYDITTAKYYALIIAVEEYKDENISDLDKPVEDATRFRDLIQSEYNFEEEHILLMKNPTKAEIIGTLHQMRTKITPEDNLLIYYAGHGYWDEEMKTGYWLPSDATQNNPVNWLPNTDLTNYLNVLKSKHTLLIADACFSGGIFKTRAAFSNGDMKSVEKLYNLTSRKALTSGTLKEVPDESVFIKYLIKNLEENTKKYLPSEQLYSSLREAVINNSPNIPQFGIIQNVGDEGGDFIFIRR